MSTRTLMTIGMLLMGIQFTLVAAADAAPSKPKTAKGKAAASAKSRKKTPSVLNRGKSAGGRLAHTFGAPAPSKGASSKGTSSKAKPRPRKGNSPAAAPTGSAGTKGSGKGTRNPVTEPAKPHPDQPMIDGYKYVRDKSFERFPKALYEGARQVDVGRGVTRTDLTDALKLYRFPDQTLVVENPKDEVTEVLRPNKEWLLIKHKHDQEVHASPKDEFTLIDKGKATHRTGPGGLLPSLPTEPPIEPLDRKRKIIDPDNFGHYTDGTPIPGVHGNAIYTGGVQPSPKNPANPFNPGNSNDNGRRTKGPKKDKNKGVKPPEGSIGGEREHRDLLDGKGNQFGSGFGINTDQADADDGNSENDPGQDGDSNDTDTTFPDDGFSDDDWNSTDNGTGSDGGNDTGTDEGDAAGDDGDTEGDGGSDVPDDGTGEGAGGGEGEGEEPGGSPGEGQPPPEGLEFPDEEPASSDPDEGWAPAEPPEEFYGDDGSAEGSGDGDTGSGDGSDDSGSGDGSDDGSGDSGSDDGSDDGSDGDDSGSDDGSDDGSDGSGSDDGSDDGSSEPEGTSTGEGEAANTESQPSVGYTPVDPDQPVVQRDPATTAVLQAGLMDLIRKRLGNQTTPPDDDTSGGDAGGILFNDVTPPPRFVKDKSLIVNPSEDSRTLPPAASLPRDGFGPSPNEILPAPDAPDAPRSGSSGPPIENEARNVGGDGSGSPQPGSGSERPSRPGTGGQSDSSSSSSLSKLTIIRKKLESQKRSRVPNSIRYRLLPPSG